MTTLPLFLKFTTEVPDPPIDVMVFATGARGLALQWTPTFDGNRPISSFIIYQWNINLTSPFMPVSMLEVGSLMFRNGSFRYNISEAIIPFNNYQFVVQACNVLGCGNVSSSSPTAMTLPDSKWIIYYLHSGWGGQNNIATILCVHIIIPFHLLILCVCILPFCLCIKRSAGE